MTKKGLFLKKEHYLGFEPIKQAGLQLYKPH